MPTCKSSVLTRYQGVLWGDEFLKPAMKVERTALSRLLDSWQRTLTRYSEAERGDLAYWWGERPNTSILAAAAWRLGGSNIAIEEYRTDRSGYGRCDLWLRLSERTLNIEAKHVWAGTAETAVSRADEELDAATSQIAGLKSVERGNMGIAACFIVPDNTSSGLTPSQWRKRAEDTWVALRHHFDGRSRYVVDVYNAPQEHLHLVQEGGSKRACPGVALVMKLVFGWHL